MNPDPPHTQRASSILGRQVRDRSGRPLGRIADLVTERDPDGVERVTAAIVVKGRWGRLLGYERNERTGPWVLERLATYIQRRDTTRVAWHELRR
jgi:sporulation protein YlmC with PRC-barrel domain